MKTLMLIIVLAVSALAADKELSDKDALAYLKVEGSARLSSLKFQADLKALGDLQQALRKKYGKPEGCVITTTAEWQCPAVEGKKETQEADDKK